MLPLDGRGKVLEAVDIRLAQTTLPAVITIIDLNMISNSLLIEPLQLPRYGAQRHAVSVRI